MGKTWPNSSSNDKVVVILIGDLQGKKAKEPKITLDSRKLSIVHTPGQPLTN